MTNAEYNQQRSAKDLEMMRHPERWPQQFLPLKQYYNTEPNGSTDIRFAMLAKSADQFYHFVPDGTDFANGRVGGDELLVELINASWLVD